jgi:hypothetical protein
MSFLLHGDNSLVRQFVSSRGVLNSIFSGMIYDKPAVVELILETLQSKVRHLCNSSWATGDLGKVIISVNEKSSSPTYLSINVNEYSFKILTSTPKRGSLC